MSTSRTLQLHERPEISAETVPHVANPFCVMSCIHNWASGAAAQRLTVAFAVGGIARGIVRTISH